MFKRIGSVLLLMVFLAVPVGSAFGAEEGVIINQRDFEKQVSIMSQIMPRVMMTYYVEDYMIQIDVAAGEVAKDQIYFSKEISGVLFSGWLDLFKVDENIYQLTHAHYRGTVYGRS